MDREKVVKGLEHCTSHDDGRDKFGGVGKCGGCPYYGLGCTDRMRKDALALLKEQEAMIVRCKDCVSFCYNNPYIGTSASNAIRCPCNSINPDWFCADGVKKDA